MSEDGESNINKKKRIAPVVRDEHYMTKKEKNVKNLGATGVINQNSTNKTTKKKEK